jgi:ribonuclease P protein component
MRDRLDRLPAGSALVVRVLPGAADADSQHLAQQLDAVLDAALSGRGRPGRPVSR